MSNINTSLSEQTPLILVVDDDRIIRSLLNLALEEEGYRVAEAKNGEQGLAEYVRLQPDMVLLDGVMPDIDGFNCCERIRQLVRGDLIPILMITVLDDRESIEQAFAVGATDYITKPLHWEVLSQRVRRLLAAYQARLEAEQVKEQLQNKIAWEQILRTTMQKLWQSPELKHTLPAIFTEIQHFFNVDQIILFEKEHKRFIASVSLNDLLVEEMKTFVANFSLEPEYTNRFQQGRIIAIDPLNQEELSSAIVTQFPQLQNNALLIAPIIVQDQLWGVLCAHHAHNIRKWQPSECEQWSDLAKLLSIALRHNLNSDYA